MLTMQTAFTLEIDDVDVAIDDIRRQLDLDSAGPSRLGILACHNDFMISGAAQAVCASLPFPVIGANTTCSATNAAAGSGQLSLLLLADDDDAAFQVAVSAPVDGNHEECVAALCRELTARNPDRKPAMGFVFSPVLPDFSEQKLVSFLDRELDGLPLFGTLACNYEEGRLIDTRIIANNETHGDRFVVALVYGDIKPVFHFATLSEEWLLGRGATVTRAEGTILMEIDGQPAVRYFESLGVAGMGTSGTHATPLVLHVPGQDAPESVAAHGQTPEGHLVCGSAAPVGASVAFGAQDWRAVLGTAKELLDAVAASGPYAGVLFYSCLSRALALELDDMAEVEQVTRRMGGGAPYMLAYSGGEICPSPRNGRLGNTFTACVFRRA